MDTSIPKEERDQFIRDNAVAIVDEKNGYIGRLVEQIHLLEKTCKSLRGAVKTVYVNGLSGQIRRLGEQLADTLIEAFADGKEITIDWRSTNVRESVVDGWREIEDVGDRDIMITIRTPQSKVNDATSL